MKKERVFEGPHSTSTSDNKAQTLYSNIIDDHSTGVKCHWWRVTKTQGFYSTLACVHDVKRFDRGWINTTLAGNPRAGIHLLQPAFTCCIICTWTLISVLGRVHRCFVSGASGKSMQMFIYWTYENQQKSANVCGANQKIFKLQIFELKKSTRGEQMENSSADTLTVLERAVGGEQLGFGRRMNKWWDVLESKCPNKTR